MEAGMSPVIKIITDGQLIRTFTSYELEKELYERNVSFEELYSAVVEEYKNKAAYENVNYDSNMYINTKRMNQPSLLYKKER